MAATLSPLFAATAQTASNLQERADRFLSLANAGYQALYRVQSIAQWDAATDVTPAHDAASAPPARPWPPSPATPPLSSKPRNSCNTAPNCHPSPSSNWSVSSSTPPKAP